jgi:hypothetical protein
MTFVHEVWAQVEPLIVGLSVICLIALAIRLFNKIIGGWG